MHDLRRTASTIMGDLGIKPEAIDRCQNHKEPNRIRRTYQRNSFQPEMKEAWQLLGARLEALTSFVLLQFFITKRILGIFGGRYGL